MSLFVCSKCGCIDNTATSCYWALIRPCKNRIYDKSLKGYEGKPLYSERNVYHMITKQDIQTAASYIFRSSFVSEDQARKVMVRAGNSATRKIIMTFRGKLFKKAFDRASRGKDINSFEKQEKVDGLNFLYNPNNDRMRNGHIIIDGTGLFKQIMKSGT